MTVPILTEPEMDKYQNLDASALDLGLTALRRLPRLCPLTRTASSTVFGGGQCILQRASLTSWQIPF